jgi:hypothetical protein
MCKYLKVQSYGISISFVPFAKVWDVCGWKAQISQAHALHVYTAVNKLNKQSDSRQ